jgi:hypothetical protein
MNEDNNYSKINNNNQFIITNKTFLEKQELPTEEEQEKKDLKYLYNLTGQNFKISSLKQDIGIFLELTNYIFTDIKAMSISGRNLKNIQIDSQQKINTESLYNNKVKCFNNNLDLFKEKIKFIKEKNNEFKKLLEFIQKIKKNDFYLDDNFDMKETDMIIDLNQFVVQHKWVNNFEGLINLKNKHFKIIKDNGEYKLDSDFYNYYNNKYVLNFIIEVRTQLNNAQTVIIQNELFEKSLCFFLVKEKKIAEENKDLLLFYMKYLLYKFFKEETNSLRKYLKNESKDEFINNGLTFVISKYPNKTSIKCNYFDNFEIFFSIKKMGKEEYNNNSNNKNYYYQRINNENKKSCFNDFNEIRNNPYLISINKLISTFFSNIFFEIRLTKNITNFIGEVKRNNNPSLENIIKNCIFVKNLTTIGLVLLKNELKNLIKMSNINHIYSLNIHEGILGKYKLYIEFLEKGNKFHYSVELVFDNNLNLTLIINEPYKSGILNFDQTQLIHIEKGRINFNYLYEMLSSIIINIGINNKNKYSQRNSI